MIIMVIDTETGGFDEKTHALLEVAAVVYDTNTEQEIEVFESMVRTCPDRIINPEALRINGINPADLVNAPSAGDVVRNLFEVAERNRTNVVSGHNVAFDLRFIEDVAKRHKIPVPFSHRTIDTQGHTFVLKVNSPDGRVTNHKVWFPEFEGIESFLARLEGADVPKVFSRVEPNSCLVVSEAGR